MNDMRHWPDDELHARADRIIELETELEAMTTAATMYREMGDALRQRLEGAVEDRRELRAMLDRLLSVALVDGYGETVRDEAETLLARLRGQ